jgi:hypothetical protein
MAGTLRDQPVCPHPYRESLPGLTRQSMKSVRESKQYDCSYGKASWMAGSSPAMTASKSVPDEHRRYSLIPFFCTTSPQRADSSCMNLA